MHRKPNSQGSPHWQNCHDIKHLQLINSTVPNLPHKQCMHQHISAPDDQPGLDSDSDSPPAPVPLLPSSPAPPSYVPQDAIITNPTIQGTAANPIHALQQPLPADHTLALPLSCELTKVLEVVSTPDSTMSKMSLLDLVFNHTDAHNLFAHLDPALLQAPFAAGHTAISMLVH